VPALGARDERTAELAKCLVDENGRDTGELRVWLTRARNTQDQHFYTRPIR
jgi:hypothetical protein